MPPGNFSPSNFSVDKSFLAVGFTVSAIERILDCVFLHGNWNIAEHTSFPLQVSLTTFYLTTIVHLTEKTSFLDQHDEIPVPQNFSCNHTRYIARQTQALTLSFAFCLDFAAPNSFDEHCSQTCFCRHASKTSFVYQITYCYKQGIS